MLVLVRNPEGRTQTLAIWHLCKGARGQDLKAKTVGLKQVIRTGVKALLYIDFLF